MLKPSAISPPDFQAQRNGQIFPYPCWHRSGRTTVWFMNQLPASYEAYLQGKDEGFIATVLPVLKQSAAEQIHGVRVLINPHSIQAQEDSSIPYGQISEGID